MKKIISPLNIVLFLLLIVGVGVSFDLGISQGQTFPLKPSIRQQEPADQLTILMSNGQSYNVVPGHNLTTFLISDIKANGLFTYSNGQKIWLCPYQMVSIKIITNSQ